MITNYVFLSNSGKNYAIIVNLCSSSGKLPRTLKRMPATHYVIYIRCRQNITQSLNSGKFAAFSFFLRVSTPQSRTYADFNTALLVDCGKTLRHLIIGMRHPLGKTQFIAPPVLVFNCFRPQNGHREL